jgi:hypothetical protein
MLFNYAAANLCSIDKGAEEWRTTQRWKFLTYEAEYALRRSTESKRIRKN